MFKKLKSFVDPLLNMIYPDLCLACDEESPIVNNCFCVKCLDELPFANLHDERDNIVEKFFWGRLIVERGTALFYFQKGEIVQEMMHRLKYKNQAFIGEALGWYYGQLLKGSDFLQGIDLILPIPMHKSKKKRRNYNQSSLIAKGIAEICNIPWSDKVLLKYSRTKSQTDKNREERLKNLKNTFKVSKPEMLKSQHVLIIDDILTTGATLEAAGCLISESGAKISIAVLAVGKY